MAVLEKYQKQPNEVIDYPISFAKWFAKRTGDSVATYTVTAEAGIDVVTHQRTGFVITVVMGGGASGTTYKVTVRMTSAAGLVKEADIAIKVKEE